MTPEQTLDWLAEQHKSQCNEDRPVQEWIRSMKSMLPAPVQEPVAWMKEGWGPDCGPYIDFYCDHEMGWRDRKEWTPLYTTPPAAQRQWVGLTQAERHDIREWQKIQEELGPVWSPMMLYLYEAIEAKLKKENA